MATQTAQLGDHGAREQGEVPVYGLVHRTWRRACDNFRLFQLIDETLFDVPVSRTGAYRALWAKYGSKRGDL